ncbi:unnamed protein product [Rotaria sp. Silwood2]|nr:unnamed protein product [Rotaria sp. Silwood2]CAF2971073.1 unnamed protein product [Rotaria sp. Silwood2]CAF3442717.1 unnamed protein product [Rotaria sp. Silwood2]CAF4316824.1 unnamed protein product [Rotaria sp. Silwood2]CAF4499892.1 unnamed protein product [Rotaria sp. Silwood2]
MQAFVMLFLVVATLISNHVHSSPTIKFTDTVVSNQMAKTFSKALLVQDEQKPSIRADSRSSYYPYPNNNWYSFPYLWPPVAGVGNQLTGLGTSVCPTSFCPTGASCSQLAGQLQCGSGVNNCIGRARFLSSLARVVVKNDSCESSSESVPSWSSGFGGI